jgi:hypothetical protein
MSKKNRDPFQSFATPETTYTFCHPNTRKIWVNTEAFPVPTTGGRTSNRAGNWSQNNVDTFTLVLFSNSSSALIDETPVKCCSHGLPTAESRGIVAKPHAQRRVLEAKAAHT